MSTLHQPSSDRTLGGWQKWHSSQLEACCYRAHHLITLSLISQHQVQVCAAKAPFSSALTRAALTAMAHTSWHQNSKANQRAPAKNERHQCLNSQHLFSIVSNASAGRCQCSKNGMPQGAWPYSCRVECISSNSEAEFLKHYLKRLGTFDLIWFDCVVLQ